MIFAMQSRKYWKRHFKDKQVVNVVTFSQDLKDDVSKAEMCAARTLLEKSTMMLLTTSKVN